ncbi:sucrase ferredoxin [Nocardioides sp. zg-536]|uniref:Sucrase ferredoxin n=1 Tax=Nocardioides faecalis TaxID=2803858 RepID=A0A938Y4K5_9ACTN|nr:sucrase ferredoxin [Nocardioides faecalis]MBM9459140.1 sucrase ferredoxin [Nocardioides faecalis]QVI57395.1 sucrase ferredoxin [Nocardioides faecalis]
MTTRDPAFRCAAASLERAETAVGTASTVQAFLLVENPGPWGSDALREARLPDGLGPALAAAAAAARVRPLLIRRPGRAVSTVSEGIRVFAAYADPVRPWLETTVVSDAGELLDLDLAALGEGRSPGLTPYDAPLLCVCTHGRHDACCAERGRPVAAALAAAHPEETWEVSHIGGDRFAANLLALPHGLYYGRVDPASALRVARAHLSGHLELDLLRGRSSYPMPVQAAEVALRRKLGETRTQMLRLVSRRRADATTTAVFATGQARWSVRVHSTTGDTPLQLTCRARRDNAVPVHEVVSITALDAEESAR